MARGQRHGGRRDRAASVLDLGASLGETATDHWARQVRWVTRQTLRQLPLTLEVGMGPDEGLGVRVCGLGVAACRGPTGTAWGPDSTTMPAYMTTRRPHTRFMDARSWEIISKLRDSRRCSRREKRQDLGL